jgi:hypothetical protein
VDGHGCPHFWHRHDHCAPTLDPDSLRSSHRRPPFVASRVEPET